MPYYLKKKVIAGYTGLASDRSVTMWTKDQSHRISSSRFPSQHTRHYPSTARHRRTLVHQRPSTSTRFTTQASVRGQRSALINFVRHCIQSSRSTTARSESPSSIQAPRASSVQSPYPPQAFPTHSQDSVAPRSRSIPSPQQRF